MATRNVEALAAACGWEILNLEDPEAPVTGGYAGDLLSWVMGRAKAGQIWVTIMTNLNIVAVATLSGVSGVVIAENAEVSEELLARAKAQGINLFRSKQDIFETVLQIGGRLSS